MSSSNLLRWSGLAALVGGVLLGILEVVEFALFGSQPDSATIMSGASIIVDLSFFVATVLVALGLVGLYACQAQEAGTLGLIAFLVAFTGTVLLAGVVWSETFIGPWLAEAAPDLLDADPSGVTLAGFSLSLGLLALGAFLFGLASLQARVLPRSAALLLMVGAVLGFVLALIEFPVYMVVQSAALAWMGYALWSDTATEPTWMAEAAT